MADVKPPELLEVGPHVYRVVVVPDGVMDDVGRYGHASLDRLVIAVAADMPHSVLVDTLLHELGHALLASVGLTEAQEERVCLALGPGLLGLLRANPALVEFVTATP
jgi:sorbitol-specific phosphotransferase system component IIA